MILLQVTQLRLSREQRLIEFNNIATASATKANAANAALTGTTTAVTVNISGTLTADTITGGAY